MTHATLLLILTLPAEPQPAPVLVLAEEGRASCTILVHRQATPPERHAAEELAYFLREVSGATFPIRSVEDAAAETGPSLRVGAAACKGIISPSEIARLGQEGYILRTKGNALAIAGGRPRGTLYGVYSFLEDHLGCRWFTPQVTRVPKKKRVVVPSLDRTFVPRLEYRDLDYVDARDPDWAAFNKLNGRSVRYDNIRQFERRGGLVLYGPFVHTFNQILPPKSYFRQHPEYFSEVNGKRLAERTQLCLSNPDVLRIATDTVRRWMKDQPYATIFSVSQNDWSNYCTCPECRRIAAEEGSQSGVYLRFVNAIADAVGKEFPDNAVDMLAYQFTLTPPAKTVARRNVIVRICDIDCCFAHPLTNPDEAEKTNREFVRALRRWGEICPRLYVWDYAINFSHLTLPYPNLYVLKPNINFFIAQGAKGVYEQANSSSKGGEFAELRAWLLAKTLWDPAYDTDRAIDEFLEGYYEEAAAPLRRYINLVHDKTRREKIHFFNYSGPASPLFAGEFLHTATALFDEAEKKVSGKPAILRRVQTARLPVLYVHIGRLLNKSKGPRWKEDDARQLRELFMRFETIARQAGVTRVKGGRDNEKWAAEIRALIAR